MVAKEPNVCGTLVHESCLIVTGVALRLQLRTSNFPGQSMDNKSKCALNSIFVIKSVLQFIVPRRSNISWRLKALNGRIGCTSSRPNYGQAGKIALPASGTSNFKSGKLSRLDDERMLMQGGEGSGSSQPRVTPTPLDK
jgi:hypothetical protein